MKYKKYTIDTIQEIVGDRPILFISKEYTGMSVKHEWQCDTCSNIWRALPNDIRRDRSNCPRCAGREHIEYKKYTIDTIHEIIKNRPIRFISKEYTRIDRKHSWQCDVCNYIWQATPNGIRQGRGCLFCAGRAYTIDDMHKLASERGFKFVSSGFTKIIDKHKWKCRDGHIWSATPNSIKAKNSGCPYCNTNLNEEKCRFVFESLIEYKFPRTRSVLDNRYELDGYCQELKLAFEYQGEQHFQKMFYHTEKRGLKEQKLRDQIKRRACKKQRITLIEVPYWVSKTDKVLENFIQEQLHISKPINWDKFTGKPTEMETIKSIARELNIECLSNAYHGDKGEIKVKCLICHHRWTRRAGYIKLRRKCPKCTNQVSLTIEEVRKICSDKGVVFLSDKYMRVNERYTYQCKTCNNTWTTSSFRIQKKGCPQCEI